MALDIGAVEQLHDEERSAVELGRGVGVRDLDDVLARDPRRRAGFATEARRAFALQTRAVEHDLERPQAARVHVLDDVDRTHATASELTDDSITPRDERSRRESVRLQAVPYWRVPRGM